MERLRKGSKIKLELIALFVFLICQLQVMGQECKSLSVDDLRGLYGRLFDTPENKRGQKDTDLWSARTDGSRGKRQTYNSHQIGDGGVCCSSDRTVVENIAVIEKDGHAFYPVRFELGKQQYYQWKYNLDCMHYFFWCGWWDCNRLNMPVPVVVTSQSPHNGFHTGPFLVDPSDLRVLEVEMETYCKWLY